MTFSIVVFTQLVSVHHQVQHVTDYNNIACVQCVSAPDQIDCIPTQAFVVRMFESNSNQKKLNFNHPVTTTKSYSARAPPSIV